MLLISCATICPDITAAIMHRFCKRSCGIAKYDLGGTELSTQQVIRRLAVVCLGLAVLCGMATLQPVDAAETTVDTRTVWTFDNDLDGWTGGVAGRMRPKYGEFGRAKRGNPGGSFYLDGCDYGSPDGKANSWLFNVVKLPADAKEIYFETRGQGEAADLGSVGGGLRLIIVDEDGVEHVVMPWQTNNEKPFVPVIVDISKFAGHTVTIRFEMRDSDIGEYQRRWVDNVTIR